MGRYKRCAVLQKYHLLYLFKCKRSYKKEFPDYSSGEDKLMNGKSYENVDYWMRKNLSTVIILYIKFTIINYVGNISAS